MMKYDNLSSSYFILFYWNLSKSGFEIFNDGYYRVINLSVFDFEKVLFSAKLDFRYCDCSSNKCVFTLEANKEINLTTANILATIHKLAWSDSKWNIQLLFHDIYLRKRA